MTINFRNIFNNFHPLVKLVFDIIMVLIIFFVGFAIGMLFLSLIFDTNIFDIFAKSGLNGSTKFLYSTQILYTINIFLLPSIIISLFFSSKPHKYLGMTKSAVPLNYFYVVILVILTLPIVNLLADLNKNIELPETFSHIKILFEEMEEKAEKLANKILLVDNTAMFLLNVFMVALLPAISEEFFFRGILQKHIIEWVKNIHIGILIASILFSAFHFQFLTFLPRVFLGLILGYLYVWSKSIWLPITAHFFNNAFAVIVGYYTKIRNIDIDKNVDNFGTEPGTYIYAIISFLIMCLFLFFINRIEKNKKLQI